MTNLDQLTLVKTDAVDQHGDLVYVSIDEWKRLYGQPGSGADQHGRTNGYFHTEPDYCEDEAAA